MVTRSLHQSILAPVLDAYPSGGDVTDTIAANWLCLNGFTRKHYALDSNPERPDYGGFWEYTHATGSTAIMDDTRGLGEVYIDGKLAFYFVTQGL